MVFELDTLGALTSAPFDAIIDVRSPAEFEEDRIPGAINLPALSNEERAKVGTIYVRESRFNAKRIGAALIARNVATHLESYFADKSGGFRALIYCWRGGQRSGAVATILDAVGYRVETLAGGYRTYRRAVVRSLYDEAYPGQVVVLDGNTGSGKTALLQAIQKSGGQVLDLEALANHRGSVFGEMNGTQPSQKGFESAIADILACSDPRQPLLVEAESSRIGNRTVPPSLWSAMVEAPRIRLNVPLDVRADFVAREYASLAETPHRLFELIAQLTRYHPRETIAEWLEMASSGALTPLAADLMRTHYDPRYEKQRRRMDVSRTSTVSLETREETAFADQAAKILAMAREISR